MKIKKMNPTEKTTAMPKKDKEGLFKTYVSHKGNQVKRKDKYGYGSGIYSGMYGKY